MFPDKLYPFTTHSLLPQGQVARRRCASGLDALLNVSRVMRWMPRPGLICKLLEATLYEDVSKVSLAQARSTAEKRDVPLNLPPLASGSIS